MHLMRRIFTPRPAYLGSWMNSIRKLPFSTSMVPVSEAVEKRNYLFSLEQKRQCEEIGRVEQITVEVCGPPEDTVLIMNQHISTPYDCCKHISLPLCQRTPLALINDKILWDMHRPLPANCRIKFLSFKDKDPYSLNEVFWRTGSFVLGAVIIKAFKDEVSPLLQKFPEVKVNYGSFFYDVHLGISYWIATEDELKVLSAEFLSFVFKNHKIERLRVKKSIALEMFEDNPYKKAEISENAAMAEDHLVTLYRVGDHIDINNGPMIGDTSFFGRSTVAAVHLTNEFDRNKYRFQGVALPKGILLNSTAYNIIVQRAAKLNEADVPGLPKEMQFYSEHSIKNSNTPVNIKEVQGNF